MKDKLTNKMIENLIIIYEIIGLCLIITLLWADELFDIPHLLFNAPPTPINWIESTIETLCIMILGVWIIILTSRSLKRIKHLEGFLPVCSSCKKIRVRNKWIPIDIYITDHSDAEFSHGYCPECLEKYLKNNSK